MEAVGDGNFYSTMGPEIYDWGIEDGAVYWVPTTVSMFGLYCNLDVLKKHKQEIPRNLGEWEQVCDYFVGRGITPIVANNDVSLKTLAIGAGFYPVYQEGRQTEAFDRRQ